MIFQKRLIPYPLLLIIAEFDHLFQKFIPSGRLSTAELLIPMMTLGIISSGSWGLKDYGPSKNNEFSEVHQRPSNVPLLLLGMFPAASTG